MSTAGIGAGFSLVWLVFAIGTTVFLLRAYSRSKLSGLLWLLGAVVVWPFCERVLQLFMPMLAASRGLAMNSLLMVSLGASVVSGVLLLIAVIVLDGELRRRMTPVVVEPSIPPDRL